MDRLKNEMTVLIAGDFCPGHRISKMVEGGDYSFFENIKSITGSHDISIVNFECPISTGFDKPNRKYGPHLKANPNAAKAIKYAGFDVAATANNHILDQGEISLLETLDILHNNGLQTVGSGKNLEVAGKTLYLNKDGKTLGIINCCEAEFSIATNKSAGAQHADPVSIYKKIKEARPQCDYLILINHGGHEMCQLPPLDMVKNFRFYIDAGADAVINHHQHVYSGYEVYNGKPIFYGLGNFCFDEGARKEPSLWNLGYMVSLSFGDEITFSIIPYDQCSQEANIRLLQVDAFNQKLEELNDIISDPEKHESAIYQYYDEQHVMLSTVIQPYSNKILAALKYRKLIPSFVSRTTMLRWLNYMECESHRAKILHFLHNN